MNCAVKVINRQIEITFSLANTSQRSTEVTHRIYTTTIEPLYNMVYYSTIRHKAYQSEVHDKYQYEALKTFHISSSIAS